MQGHRFSPTPEDDKTSAQGSAHLSASNHFWIKPVVSLFLGLGLTALLVWTFVYAPDSIPVYKQLMVGISSAIVAGLFAFFFTGAIRLGTKSLKTPLGDISLTASAGIGVFSLVLLWWLISLTPALVEKRPSPSPNPTPDKRTAELIVSLLAPMQTESGVNKVALNMDGELLASAEDNGKAKLWQVKSGGPPKELARNGKPSSLRCIVISPNGETIAAGDDIGNVRIWSNNETTTPTLITSHTGAVFELYFSGDGLRLVSTGVDKGNIRSARLWKVSGKPELLKTFMLPDLQDQVLTISPDLLNIALYNPQHKRIEIWSMSEKKLTTALENSELVTRAGGAFSSDGQLIAIGSDDGTVRIWQVPDGKHLKDLVGRSEATISVVFHPSGRLVAAGYTDGSVRLWSISDANNPKVLKEQSQKVFSVAFSGNGRVLASGSEDGKIQLWEVREEFR